MLSNAFEIQIPRIALQYSILFMVFFHGNVSQPSLCFFSNLLMIIAGTSVVVSYLCIFQF